MGASFWEHRPNKVEGRVTMAGIQMPIGGALDSYSNPNFNPGKQLSDFAPSDASRTAGLLGDVASFVPVVGPILSGIFKITDWIISSNDRKKAVKKADQMYQEGLARDEQRHKDQMGIANRQLAQTDRTINNSELENMRGWAWKEQEQDFTRAMGIFDRMTNMLTLNQNMRNNIVSLNMKRAA
jgi:hypothetical protein